MKSIFFDKTWAGLVIVLLILFLVCRFLLEDQFNQDFQVFEEKTHNEISFLSTLVHNRLQEKNYQLANSIINNWGLNTSDTLDISLETDDGYELARYSSNIDSKFDYQKETQILYGYDGQVTLYMRKNLSEVYDNRVRFRNQLILAYFFVGGVLWYLVFIARQLLKQTQSLKKENSQRIEAEQALREREQHLFTTLNSIGDGVITTDEKGLITQMNPVAEKLTGWLFKEARGRPVIDIFSIIDATSRKPIPNPVEKVLSSGKTIYLKNHTKLISKSGIEFNIADSAAPIRNSIDNILGMVLVFNDVTEQYTLRELARKKTRQIENESALLRSLIDSIPDLIYIKDTGGVYKACNLAFEKLLGKSEELIIGKTDFELFGEERARVLLKRDKEIQDSKLPQSIEEWVTYPDGKKVLFTNTVACFFNSEGVKQGIIGISRDITLQRQKDEQLGQSSKMEALGKLTGGIAHDYNNMLGVIIGYAELLKDMLENQDDLKKYADAILHAGERGEKLTKKLLVFSRQKSISASKVDINLLLQNERDMLEKTLTPRIHLKFELEDEIWPVWLDEGDLEDAIVNLSINAMHSMVETGCLTIESRNITLNHIDAHHLNVLAGDYVQLSIRDTGKGIEEEHLKHIFDPFFTTKGDKGTGLGLSQVYGFVQRSLGAINVISEPMKGTIIDIYFPRSMESTYQSEEEITEGTSIKRGSETILVVDDEFALNNFICEILKNHGYKVFSAGDGIQALEVLDETSVDLIVSDVVMPNMDGRELSIQAKEKYPDVKFLIVSGFNEYPQLNDELDLEILQKPVKSKTLLRKARLMLDS